MNVAPNAALKMAIFTSGQTQEAIARLAGINESRMSRIVRGYMEADEDEKKALAKILRASVSQLFPAPNEKASA